MCRWRMGLAVSAVWLSLIGGVQAQQYAPTPVGAARMPEPLGRPLEEPLPNLIPGGLTPALAPPGPPDSLSLPAGHSSAFQLENYSMETAFYASAGVQWLQRQRLGKGAAGLLDFGNLDTGLANAPPGSPVALAYDDILPPMALGLRGTVGYLWGNQAIELTGFHVFDRSRVRDAVNLGQIDTFFFNAPLGFEGNNNLFLQADRVSLEFTSSLTSAELNYRVWNGGIHQVELILGVRYMHLREKLNTLVDDDGFTFLDINGQPDLTRRAIVGSQTHNHLIAPQIGMEYSTPLPLPILRWVWFGCSAKAAWGVNVININNTLTRGDGFSGYNTRTNTTGFGQIYDLGAFVDFHMLERMRVRAGYNAIWMVGVATAQDQISFNLGNTLGPQDKAGTVLYHGPQIELQFLF